MTLAYDKEAWRASVQNGKIPASKLAEVWPEQYDRDLGGPALMHPEAALAMGAMLRQAWEDGWTDLRLVLSYRTYAKQLEKWAAYKAGTGNLAAVPGTSNHGWAVAGDMGWSRSGSQLWMRNNSRRYGFIFDVPSENWHITYQENMWGGSELTEDEKKLLTWLEGFKTASTGALPGRDTGPAMGRALADAAKHAEASHVTKKHQHKEKDAAGLTGPAVEP